ncbi:glycosyltransferase family 4 protein [Spirosoma humi]
MKILITHLDFNAYFPLRLKHFKTFLENRGHELFIVESIGKPMLYEFSNVDKIGLNIITLFPNKSYKDVTIKGIKSKLTRILNQLNPDVILVGTIVFPPSATAIQWAKRHRKGIVVFENARKDTFPRSKLNNWIKKIIFRNIEAFLCPSNSYDDSLIYWGFKKEQIFYGLNVTDNKFWEEKVENINFKHLPEQYFLTVGRQMEFKNLSFYIDSYIQYRNSGGSIPLVMVGEGPCHNDLVERNRLGKEIIFLPFQDYEHIRELFINARALFLPSFKKETWGLIVNEAMAAGTIVAVSTDCGCCDTLVQNNVNGFSFNPLDSADLIDVMYKIENLEPTAFKNMKCSNKSIISAWGLDRFSEGAYDAAVYANNNRLRGSIFDTIIINLWNGQLKAESIK